MKDLIYKDLTYKVNGTCFKAHKKLGRFCRERQYCDEIENLLKENKISYRREHDLQKINLESPKGNKADFIIEDKIIIDIKAKKFITKEDYYQVLRYLEAVNLELGIIYNFRNTYLKPKRILNSRFKNPDNPGA